MRVIILFSGGISSVAMLHKAVVENHDIDLLYINFGDINSNKIKDIIQYYYSFFHKSGYGRINIHESFTPLGWYSGGIVNEKIQPTRRNSYYRTKVLGNNYIPFRNGLLLSYAISLSEDIKAREIWMGLYSVDNPYPDNDIHDLKSFVKAGYKISIHKPKINFPFEYDTKKEIYCEYIKDKNYGLYWECQKATLTSCGKCDGCLNLKDAIGDDYVL